MPRKRGYILIFVLGIVAMMILLFNTLFQDQIHLYFFSKNYYLQHQRQMELASLQGYIKKKVDAHPSDFTSDINPFLKINELHDPNKQRWRVNIIPITTTDLKIEIYFKNELFNSNYIKVDASS